MANFVSRNVLLCVVPAVVILLSVFWFRKKKKMKPNLSFNTNTLPASKTNDALDSQGSIYSSVESTSDFSNTLSDASSISSPENSSQSRIISCKASEDTADGTYIKETLSISNHVDYINSQDISLNKVRSPVANSKSETCKQGTCENNTNLVTAFTGIEELISTNFEKLAQLNVDDSPINIPEIIGNSLHSLDDALESYLSENEHITNADNISSDLSNGLHSSITVNSLLEFKHTENLNTPENCNNGIIEEPVISKIENNFLTNMINDQNETCLIQDPDKTNESDSHSSVLDENSLSSISDDSERHLELKYKDSPSSVFDGNSISISDESEKTDVSNEPMVLNPKENGKGNIDYVSNEMQSNSCISNVQYSIQLNKNSFFAKTILSNDVDNAISSSSSFDENVTNSPTSLKHSNFVVPDSFQSSELNEVSVVVQHNNLQPLSDADCSSNDTNITAETALIGETISSTSEDVSCTLLNTNCNQANGQSETAVTRLSCETTVSSSTDKTTIDIQDPAKVDNTMQLDSISTLTSSPETINLKTQDNQLESLSQTKVADLDMDIKGSGIDPGLFVYEFDLPQELCGRLIGKQGKHVKSIKERTDANVFIKRHPFDSNLKTVVVEGSRSSVHEALDIIRRKFPPSQFPAVTLIQTNMLSSHGVSLPESLQLHLPEGASCDVILSSLVSAGHFFLQQPTHPTYPSLSTLDQCMISCYSQMDTPLLPHPVEAGVICAAPVMNGWFRAQVIYVYENSSECEVKFVDYGGFSQVLTASLRQIRSDFMTLPFQASECYLANVRPIDRNTGWSSEATSVFEELAQGQILQALLVEYAEDGIPCVHLYRVQGVSNMFINRELVERGLGVWVDNGHWDTH